MGLGTLVWLQWRHAWIQQHAFYDETFSVVFWVKKKNQNIPAGLWSAEENPAWSPVFHLSCVTGLVFLCPPQQQGGLTLSWCKYDAEEYLFPQLFMFWSCVDVVLVKHTKRQSCSSTGSMDQILKSELLDFWRCEALKRALSSFTVGLMQLWVSGLWSCLV